jgi:hypothetical protein
MPKYLVCFSESPFEEQEFKIVNASSKSEAIDKFIKVFAVTDDDFLEHVYDRAVNASFAERFWMQTQLDFIHFNGGRSPDKTSPLDLRAYIFSMSMV